VEALIEQKEILQLKLIPGGRKCNAGCGSEDNYYK
jgi:hypothetical protein